MKKSHIDIPLGLKAETALRKLNGRISLNEAIFPIINGVTTSRIGEEKKKKGKGE